MAKLNWRVGFSVCASLKGSDSYKTHTRGKERLKRVAISVERISSLDFLSSFSSLSSDLSSKHVLQRPHYYCCQSIDSSHLSCSPSLLVKLTNRVELSRAVASSAPFSPKSAPRKPICLRVVVRQTHSARLDPRCNCQFLLTLLLLLLICAPHT